VRVRDVRRNRCALEATINKIRQLKSACIVTAKTKLETISAGGPPVISKALLSTTAYSFGGRAYGGALTGFVAW
jgi:hypothetical protein